MARRFAAIAMFVLIAVAAVGPIRSYDFFWHLATGRWITEHHALPVYDPFTLASAHVPWINGEWLYEVVLYQAESLTGLRGVSWVNALFVAAMFTLGFWAASRRGCVAPALLTAAIAFAGAADVLGLRPAATAALLLVCALALLDSELSVLHLAIAYAVVTALWINIHPSALLAPVLAATTLATDLRRWPIPVASAAALLLNPFGWKAVIAPVQLTQLIGTGEFVNAEWLPSTPDLFPLLFATLAAIVLLNLFTRPKREDIWRIAVFVLLATLAVRHIRNQGLYFAALPLLLPSRVRTPRRLGIVLAICALIPIGWIIARRDHRPGVDDVRYPVRAAGKLKSARLPGNIYNVDQFGGYLEWVFYPQRRVLTDGRNELFRDFIALDARARKDSRVWHALVRQYAIDLAVDEYQSERVQVVDVASGASRFLPPSLVRYRRRDWALIAFDDAAMVFARRAAFPPDTITSIEYRYLVPDDPFIGYINEDVRKGAVAEVERARREFGDLNVVRRLEEGTRATN